MSSARSDDIDWKKWQSDARHPGASENLWKRRSELPSDQRTSSGRNEKSQNPLPYRIPKKRDHSEIDNSPKNGDENRPSGPSSQSGESSSKKPNYRQHDQEKHREPTSFSNSGIRRERGRYDPRASSVPLSSSRSLTPGHSTMSSSSGGRNQPLQSSHNSRNESERSSEANVNDEPESPPVQRRVASSTVWTKEKEAALITFVRARPFMHDSSDPLYQDKNKMYNSWRTICRDPRLKGETIKQVRIMWESLCRTYYGELARLADGLDRKLSEEFMQSMNFLPDTKEPGPLSTRPQVNARTSTGQFLKLVEKKFQPYSPAEVARLEVNILKVFADFGEPASAGRH